MHTYVIMKSLPCVITFVYSYHKKYIQNLHNFFPVLSMNSKKLTPNCHALSMQETPWPKALNTPLNRTKCKSRVNPQKGRGEGKMRKYSKRWNNEIPRLISQRSRNGKKYIHERRVGRKGTGISSCRERYVHPVCQQFPSFNALMSNQSWSCIRSQSVGLAGTGEVPGQGRGGKRSH